MLQEPELISYHYDSTGVFHWCRARDMDKCLYSRQEIIIIIIIISIIRFIASFIIIIIIIIIVIIIICIIIIIHYHQAGDGRNGPQQPCGPLPLC